MRRASNHHTARREGGLADLAGALLPFVAGPAVAFSMFPGFLLCVPGIVLVGVVVVPLVALGAVLTVAAAIAAMPVAAARAVLRRHAARRGETE